MKPVSKDYEENRRKADDENRNGTLTKAALAAIDAAGIPDAPLDPRVMQLYQLRDILGEYKLPFDWWHSQQSRKQRVEKYREERELKRKNRQEGLTLEDIKYLVKKYDSQQLIACDQFFPNEVFSLLRHISLPDGLRLEIGYEGNFSFGGQAVFLATGNGTSIPVVDALCLDDSPEAYWEAFILWFTARQFYLYWHANYGTEAIVYDLRYFLGTYRDGDRTGGMVFDQLTAAEQRQLMGMKLTPEVKRNPEGGCDVLCTQFSPFSGFQRLQHSIVKKDVGIAIKFPSKCLESIYYNCGVMY